MQYYKSIHVSHMSILALSQFIGSLDQFKDEDHGMVSVVESVYFTAGSGSIIFNQEVPAHHIADAVDECGLVAKNHGLTHYT